ncbi:unnamed protein product, partial [Ascophyllum nodosum]
NLQIRDVLPSSAERIAKSLLTTRGFVESCTPVVCVMKKYRNSGDAYTLHVIDGAHRVRAFAMAESAVDRYNADRCPRAGPTSKGDS